MILLLLLLLGTVRRRFLFVSAFMLLQWVGLLFGNVASAMQGSICNNNRVAFWHEKDPCVVDDTNVSTTETTAAAAAATAATTTTSNHPSNHNKTKNSLRICIVVEPSPLTYMSGYANRFCQLFLELQRCHDDVVIVTTEVVQPKTSRPRQHLGFPVVYTRGFRLPYYPIMSISCDWTLVLPRTLLWSRRHGRPDLIHVSSPGMYLFWAILWSRLAQIPLVMSYHTHLPVYVQSYLPRLLAAPAQGIIWFLLRMCHHWADLTLVTSCALQAEFAQHGLAGAALWDKGIDTRRFHPKWASAAWRRCLTGTAPLDQHENTCSLLYVGRLAVEKRLHELHAILQALPKHYRLALVGQGPHQDELKALFADMADRVVFVGPLYDEDLWAAYASADIFVLPSDSETLGFVVMEAMASGIPVVAANAGGIPDMVQDDINGYLVTVGDVAGYVRAIQRIGINQHEARTRLGRQARALAETWTWEESMRNLRQELYPLALQNFRNRFEQRLWRWATRQK